MIFVSDLKPGKLYNVNIVNMNGTGPVISVEMFLSYSKVASNIDGYTRYELNFLRGKFNQTYSFVSNTSLDETVSIPYLGDFIP